MNFADVLPKARKGTVAFFASAGALGPQQQQDIPRVKEIGKKYGLEILPPPGA